MRQSRQHLTDATEIAELHGMDDVAKIDLTNSVQFQVGKSGLYTALRRNCWLSFLM